MDGDDSCIPATGHSTLPNVAWEQARLRTRLISELAERDPVGLDAADRAAVELGISRRRFYVLLQLYRQGSGLVTDLANRRSDGGNGGHWLPAPARNTVAARIASLSPVEVGRRREGPESVRSLQSAGG